MYPTWPREGQPNAYSQMAAQASKEERKKKKRQRTPKGADVAKSKAPRHIAVINDAFLITKTRVENSQAVSTFIGSTSKEVKGLSLKDVYAPKVLKHSIVLNDEGCTSLYMNIPKQGVVPLEKVAVSIIEKNLSTIITAFQKLVVAMGIIAKGPSIDESKTKRPSVYLLKEELGQSLLALFSFSKPVHNRIIECLNLRNKLSDDEIESLRSVQWANPALSHTLYKGDKFKKVKFLIEVDKCKLRSAFVTSFFTGTEKWHEPLREFCTMMINLIDQVPVKTQISNKSLHQAILENNREIQEMKKALVSISLKSDTHSDQNVQILDLLKHSSKPREPK